jgi:hypothetical protein
MDHVSLKSVHGIWLANVGTQAVVLRELRCCVITLLAVLISYRRFGTTYRARLQGSRMVSRNDDTKSPLRAA